MITVLQVQYRENPLFLLFLEDGVDQGKRVRVVLSLLVQTPVIHHQSPLAFLLLWHDKGWAGPLTVGGFNPSSLNELGQQLLHGLGPIALKLVLPMTIDLRVRLQLDLRCTKPPTISRVLVGDGTEYPRIGIDQPLLQLGDLRVLLGLFSRLLRYRYNRPHCGIGPFWVRFRLLLVRYAVFIVVGSSSHR